jgi:hypothetical protein
VSDARSVNHELVSCRDLPLHGQDLQRGPVLAGRQGARDGEQSWEADTPTALLYKWGISAQEHCLKPLVDWLETV